jgi:hypothetical protein
MKITADDLSRSYRAMSDEQLLAMDQDELTDIARKTLEAEMERRGLTHRDPAAPPSPVEIDVDPNAWASAGMFQYLDQARVYLPVLEDAGIPAEIEENADVLWVGSTALPAVRLLVPESMLEDAQAAIEDHASREELIAREHADPATLIVPAHYVGGVFEPLEAVDWEEGTEVEVRRRTR